MKKLREYQRLLHFRRGCNRIRMKQSAPARKQRSVIAYEERVAAFESSCAGVPRLETHRSSWIGQDHRTRPCQKLSAPENFCYSENPDAILQFVYSLRREGVLRGRIKASQKNPSSSLYIDLDSIRTMDLEGALILSAELDRVRQMLGVRPWVDDANWSPGIRAILHEFGFYRLVDARRVAKNLAIPDIKIRLREERNLSVVKFVSGRVVDGREALRLQDDLVAEEPAAAENRSDLYEGLIEAFTNAATHAYDIDIPGDGLFSTKRWWAGGLMDTLNGYLYIAVYDQGVGIPASLPRKPFWKSISSAKGFERTDAQVIAGGLDYGRTRLSQEGRGNGLWFMCHIVDGFKEAAVRFTSGHGEVTYNKGGAMELRTISTRFPGTMVRWRIRLPLRDKT